MSVTTFKGVEEIGKYTISDCFKANLKTWLDWCMLEIGGFSNVNHDDASPSSGFSPSGIKLSEFSLVSDPSYVDGTVYESFKHDLVWETGLNYSSQPQQIENVYINDILFNGDYYVDYPLGRIIFDEPLETGDVVTADYSYRYYNSYIADLLPGFQQIVNTLEPNDLLAQSRVHLPAIIIEVITDKSFRGLELGGGQWVIQDVLFHVYSATKSDRDKALDILSFQRNKTFYLFNYNDAFDDGKMPLDANGSINDDGIMYPQMVTDYFWKKVFVKNVACQEKDAVPGTYAGVVRYSLESAFPNI